MDATVVYLPESCVRVLTVPACLPVCLSCVTRALCPTFYVRYSSVCQSIIPASASGSVAAQQENKGQRTSRTGTTTTAAATSWQQKQQKQQKPKKAEAVDYE